MKILSSSPYVLLKTLNLVISRCILCIRLYPLYPFPKLGSVARAPSGSTEEESMIYIERAMELKLTGIALNRPKNHIGGKKYTREVRWLIFI